MSIRRFVDTVKLICICISDKLAFSLNFDRKMQSEFPISLGETVTNAIATPEPEPSEELTPEQIRALASLSQFAGDTELRAINSYEDALALATQINGTVLDISEELGSGFVLLDDKDKLIGEEFALIQWRFTDGDWGVFVSAALVTKGGAKYIINDGSTGIRKMLLDFSQRTHRFGGIKVPNGLRKSDYPTCPECGKPMSRDEIVCSNEKCGYEGEKRSIGITHYLDTSAEAK